MAEQETVTKTTLLSIKHRQETEGYIMNKLFQVIRIFYNIHSNSMPGMTQCSKKNPSASTVAPGLVIKVVGKRWKPREHGNWFLSRAAPPVEWFPIYRIMNT